MTNSIKDYGKLKNFGDTPSVNMTVEALKEITGENTRKNDHYQFGIETIDYMQGLGDDKFLAFCQLNIIKYVSRYEEKGGVSDLLKAEYYLERMIKTLSEDDVKSVETLHHFGHRDIHED